MEMESESKTQARQRAIQRERESKLASEIEIAAQG
jgi:hypothetical protein